MKFLEETTLAFWTDERVEMDEAERFVRQVLLRQPTKRVDCIEVRARAVGGWHVDEGEKIGRWEYRFLITWSTEEEDR